MGEPFEIDFHVFPMTPDNKEEQETQELDRLRSLGVDLIILARYMQILTPWFVGTYPNRIINIHHSFLPAFVGEKPYHRAYQRGVKLIGATCHYVTEKVDDGPIIDQDVCRISHRDSAQDLIRKGRDLERQVLARAVRLHLLNRVLPYGKKNCSVGLTSRSEGMSFMIPCPFCGSRSVYEFVYGGEFKNVPL